MCCFQMGRTQEDKTNTKENEKGSKGKRGEKSFNNASAIFMSQARARAIPKCPISIKYSGVLIPQSSAAQAGISACVGGCARQGQLKVAASIRSSYMVQVIAEPSGEQSCVGALQGARDRRGEGRTKTQSPHTPS